jgi:DNA adenine methylase
MPSSTSSSLYSPFRYPGGKTWLIPLVRCWLRQAAPPELLVEPFAGGGIVGLTAAFESLADRVLMTELDEEVAAVWKVILQGESEWLAEKILAFELTHENIARELGNPCKDTRDLAFCTLLKNRVFHGGIIAKGSGMLKAGENGRGIASRWYPQTLAKRIRAIEQVRQRIRFRQADAFEVLEAERSNAGAFFFIDPPYTRAGRRLYTHFDLDHEKLLRLTARLEGRFLLTYDDTEEIRTLAAQQGLPFRTIPMKTTHHLEKRELILSDHFGWWPQAGQ